jgi:hypothetical protein
MKSIAPAIAPPSLPSAPPPPPPIADDRRTHAGAGLFHRLKSYFLGLPTLAKVGWVCLGIGILFSAKYEPAFLGVIIALVLGIIGIFRIPRRDGVILGAAAFLTFVTILILSLGTEVASKRLLTHKQQLVSELKTSFRSSLINDKTMVLVIRNPNSESVDFYLRCYALDSSSRRLFVTAPALDTAEIGILQGWVFVPGERFEAICEDAVIWRREVP